MDYSARETGQRLRKTDLRMVPGRDPDGKMVARVVAGHWCPSASNLSFLISLELSSTSLTLGLVDAFLWGRCCNLWSLALQPTWVPDPDQVP